MDRQTLAQEITQYLTEQGAVRVGFADLHGVTGASLPYGVTALVAALVVILLTRSAKEKAAMEAQHSR